MRTQKVTWLERANDDSAEKKGMSGCVRLTSLSICSMVSVSYINKRVMMELVNKLNTIYNL